MLSRRRKASTKMPAASTANQNVQSVALSVQCRNVMDWNVFSKANPMVSLLQKRFGSDDYVEIGRTEVVNNTLNPDFVEKLLVEYVFEERQFLKFRVEELFRYDVTTEEPDHLIGHDFIGEMDCTVAELLAQIQTERTLTGKNVTRGTIIVTAERLGAKGANEEVTMTFTAHKLDKKDFFGKSDPYLAFYKLTGDGSEVLTHRTEYIKNTLNPHWKPFAMTARDLCSGDPTRIIIIKVFDWNRDGTEKHIGSFDTTLNDLMQSEGKTWDVINDQLKKAKKGYKSSGKVTLKRILLKKVPQFPEYVRAGTQLACVVGIDFTNANGDPKLASSWHHVGSAGSPNWYSRALKSVMSILQDYDTDKLFPVYGFGALLPGIKDVQHCFHVNLDPEDPNCMGERGVTDAYNKCVRTVQLASPTKFAPLIRKIAAEAASSKNGQDYYILLILTAGELDDLVETRDAVVEAAKLPMSIVIIGIGNGNFDNFQKMVILDGDTVRLKNRKGEPAERDMVQFVPFRDFMKVGQTEVSQARFAKDVLAEIPSQFIQYMRIRNIQPGQWKSSLNAQTNGDSVH